MEHYIWFAVNTGKLCPTGWHVPSYGEWGVLIDFLNDPSQAGGKLKVAGTDYWLSPNTGATNESGFTALPGGARDWYGSYVTLKEYANFWTATEANETLAYYLYLHYTMSTAQMWPPEKISGYSVRCVKNN